MNEKITQRFDIGENENEAIFPSRYIDGKVFVMVRKDQFTVTETERMIILEQVDDFTNQ